MFTFGERLRASMALACVSVSELARYCKVSRTTVQTWRKMEKAHLSVDHLLLIDRRLKTNLRWLASGEGSPVPSIDREVVHS